MVLFILQLKVEASVTILKCDHTSVAELYLGDRSCPPWSTSFYHQIGKVPLMHSAFYKLFYISIGTVSLLHGTFYKIIYNVI